ncbi:MAG: threonylcarbamoyl-AMP synthase [Candidatus Aenigmarchaeota archaeon]|nr:threonylcarbamoyl-AMP synthase [Candidatus Aenigmarchaeota archaeon]
MRIIKQEDLLQDDGIKQEFLQAVKTGAIFIHPTDTVYGLGCNIENLDSIKKIYQLKQREENKPISIVAPSKEWIYQNFHVSDANKGFIERLLPGPYTLVLKAKNKFPDILVKDGAVGLRIPKHPVIDLIRQEAIIFTTTSLNIAEQDVVTKIEDAPQSIKDGVEIAIDFGQLRKHASRVFDLTTDEVKIIRP